MSHSIWAMRPNKDGIQDLYIENGNFAVARDAEAISQHISYRLKFFEGEWFLNSATGVSWLTDIHGRPLDRTLSEAIIKSAIVDTDGVTSITNFSVNFNSRTRHISTDSISVSTIYDEV